MPPDPRGKARSDRVRGLGICAVPPAPTHKMHSTLCISLDRVVRHGLFRVATGGLHQLVQHAGVGDMDG